MQLKFAVISNQGLKEILKGLAERAMSVIVK
ncbi:hypothetical protein NIES3275_32170 [Microchaete diplosiphon NIES-3275]|nr:hypothetical protein NIES3275_32170 [Microchaete diplosiphon NIES-3275]